MTLKTVLRPIPQGEINMGLTHVTVSLLTSNSTETYDANFLVDTGTTDTMAPASELRRIGIEPVGKDVFEIATGELVEFEFGVAKLTFMNEIIATRVLFGPDGSEPLLGVIALESAGFIVDPKHQRLRKLRARPLKQLALAK